MSGGMIAHGIAYLELPPDMYICSDGVPCGRKVFCA